MRGRPSRQASLSLTRCKPGSTKGCTKTGARYSPTHVRLMHVTLRRALRDAVRLEYVSRNVAAVIDAPAKAPFEGTAWSVDEAVALALQGPRIGRA